MSQTCCESGAQGDPMPLGRWMDGDGELSCVFLFSIARSSAMLCVVPEGVGMGWRNCMLLCRNVVTS